MWFIEAGVLECSAEFGPIHVAVGNCLSSCLMKGHLP